MPKRPKTTKPTTPELLVELVGKPNKPPKNKQPKIMDKLPQKPRSSAKRNRTRKVKEATNLAHITKAIVAEGGTVPDVGVILGCQTSEGSGEWLERLKAEDLSLVEFLEVAKQRADIELVRVATKTALGYEYEETTQESMPEYDELGQPTGRYLPGKKKTAVKRERDAGLLKFLLMSRMPDYFTDTKHIEINKRTVELKMDAEQEIRGFAAGLLKALDGDVIDAEFVEKETER